MPRVRFAAAFVCAFLALCVAPLGAASDPHEVLIAGANAARVRLGLPALSEDATLDRFAAGFARRMLASGRFGHTLPDGTTFVDRLRAAHVSFRWAAENLAEDADAVSAERALVQSSAHYANIVAPVARHIGAAVLPVEPGLALFVEEFRD